MTFADIAKKNTALGGPAIALRQGTGYSLMIRNETSFIVHDGLRGTVRPLATEVRVLQLSCCGSILLSALIVDVHTADRYFDGQVRKSLDPLDSAASGCVCAIERFGAKC
jgi:hypothetical protein